MSEQTATRKRRQQVVSNVVLTLVAFAAGTGAGAYYYATSYLHATAANVEEHDHSHDDHQHAHGDDDHLDLTEQAVANLALQLGKVELGEYWKKTAFPGEVVEIPGQSDLSVAAPVAGVIEQVAIREGQSVELGDELFDLRITDPLVTTAQADLLSVLAKLEVNNREIDRLRPLASEGLVGKNRKRELEYEVEKLKAEKEAKSQEILARGLPETTLEHVLRTGSLTKRILIAMPNYVLGDRPPRHEITKQVGLSGKASYSIGHINTHPGQAVQAGQHLCSLMYHGQLYIRGQAFESDVAAINEMCERNWGITAEFGHQHADGHQHIYKRENLQITRIDNHVSSEGVFSFFVPIDNEVKQEFRSEGRLYQQWQFRPGQRVHLWMPVAKLENKIKLPVEAVAMSGPNAIVFRKQTCDHDHDVAPDVAQAVGIGVVETEDDVADEHDHDHHDVHEHAFLQLEPVPVHVLHRGHDFVVIEPEGELHVGDEVAMNAAYKLQLAMQMAAGGGGHGHSHEH